MDLFETPLTEAQLTTLLRKLGKGPRELLRKKDPAYLAERLASREPSDAELVALMARHPGLIERPIVVRGRRAVVARPPEKIETLLE